MEALKNIVITLVTVLIFISAVELLIPNNKMKKYINFVLGLILISVILNPIVNFISNGEKSILGSIKSCEEIFSKNTNQEKLNNVTVFKDEGKQDSKKQAFINNFNKNCDKLLKDKFKDMNFKSDIDCDVDFNKVALNIKKLRIGVADNKISKVKKVVINTEDKNSKDTSSEYAEIINYISAEVDVPKEKIEVHKLDE